MMFLVLSFCLFPSLATAATPHIYDAPNAGPPGSQTQTVGNGWDPNATLDIYLDSTHVGLVDTDSNGTFGMALKAPTLRQNGLTITIPKDAVPGQHWITAVERITQLQAQVAFRVGADWAQFHYGPDHVGVNPYENVLSPETVGNLTTRWTWSGSYATPVVANGAVYTADWSNFYALNADTGALLWSYPAQGWYWAPAVANGVVYFSANDFYLYALNATSGAFLWRYGSGVSTPPTLVNGVVYVATTCNVDALNADTGTLLWTSDAGCRWGIQQPPTVANGVLYIGTDYGYLYALNAVTGGFLWKFTGTQYQSFDAPAVTNGIVYAMGTDGIFYAINANTGALLWKYITGYGQSGGSPAVVNGVVYVSGGAGNLYALNASTGEVLWTYAGASYFSSPAVANGVVYAGSEDTNVYAFDASTGAVLWTYTTAGQVVSSPAVVNGMMYIDDIWGYLYAFALPDQQRSEKFSPPERPDPARLTPNWNPPLKK